MNRPTSDRAHGSYVTTPIAATMMALLGTGATQGAVALTRDEWRHVKRLYGYEPEKPRTKPPLVLPKREDFATSWKYEQAAKAATEAHAKWTDPSPFFQAGADRNALRHAEADGLRMLAWIAKYVPPGEDPVKHLVQLAIDAGWDVDPSDVAWAQSEGEEEETEAT